MRALHSKGEALVVWVTWIDQVNGRNWLAKTGRLTDWLIDRLIEWLTEVTGQPVGRSLDWLPTLSIAYRSSIDEESETSSVLPPIYYRLHGCD